MSLDSSLVFPPDAISLTPKQKIATIRNRALYHISQNECSGQSVLSDDGNHYIIDVTGEPLYVPCQSIVCTLKGKTDAKIGDASDSEGKSKQYTIPIHPNSRSASVVNMWVKLKVGREELD